MKQTVIIIIVAIFALVTGVTVQSFNKSPKIQTVLLSAISLPDLNGQQQSLSTWEGKILIINFWASWCPPCLKEIPDFMELQTEYADKNVQFIGIALEDLEAVAAYNSEVKINYPILIAPNSGAKISHSWGNIVNTIPFTVILNPKGEIIHRQMGEFSKTDILKIIQPLLSIKKLTH